MIGDTRSRALTIRRVWDRFDHALDLHSTSQDSPPMVIALARSNIGITSRFPIKIVISNIDAIQIGRPASYFYGSCRVPVYGIEAGTHEAEDSFRLAVICSLSFLSSLGVISNYPAIEVIAQKEYRVFDSVLIPNDGQEYELVKILQNFEPIFQGQELVRGNETSIFAERDSYALMCPSRVKPLNPKEEVLFLADRIEHPVD